VSRNEHILPVFPLATIALFPRVRTPLHIFEPRYRQMTEHALAADRRIAMALVRPDAIEAIAGDPPVYPVACAGVIREFDRLPDGRFNLVLDGTERVRILEELARPRGQLYRCARVRELDDACDPECAAQLAAMHAQVIALIRGLFGDDGGAIPSTPFRGIDDAAFVNALCAALPISTPEKQGLLEADGIPARFERLIDVLNFLSAERAARRVPNSRAFH
jgi:hypothetical protein